MGKLKKNRNQKVFTMSLLVIYLLVITWIILFKMSFSFQDLPNFRNINLIAFADSVIVNNQINISEIIGNVLIFISFGVYISMLKPDWGIFKKIAPIAGVSCLFELLQFIFAIGATDITDLIGNTLGGIIGIGIYSLLLKLFKMKINKVLNVLASIGTTLVIVLLGSLVLINP